MRALLLFVTAGCGNATHSSIPDAAGTTPQDDLDAGTDETDLGAADDLSTPPDLQPTAPPVARPAYYVAAGKLYDPCGEEVIPRGVNKMAVYIDRAGDSFPEIAKTGANTVRFMWFTAVPASEAVQTLQRAVDSGLIPIWEMHDATGDFSKMPQIETYWTAADTVTVLKQFESRLLVNIANEAGQTVSDNDLVTTYTRIIGKLRTAGLRMPVIIDAAGYGRNVEQLLRIAPSILAADGNALFSWHVYDPGANQPARIDSALATAKAQKIPFLMGEFANLSPGACGQTVPYLDVITKAQAAGVGYIPWSWDNSNSDCDGGSGSPFNMVSDGLHFSTLTAGWATEVVMSNAASIKNTSRRTYYQTNGKCKGAP